MGGERGRGGADNIISNCWIKSVSPHLVNVC